MFWLTYSLKKEELKKHFKWENPLYIWEKEIDLILNKNWWKWINNNFYTISSSENPLKDIFDIIDILKNLEWFKDSCWSIYIFKIEEFSDFSEIIN